ncbi:MAG TPA: LptF/LptG family permease, partial [Rhodothermales bacterium]
MTIPEAAEYLESLRRAGVSNLGRPAVTYYSKYSYPLASLIVVLLGVPLASIRRRRGQAIQLAIGLFVAFVYLATLKVTEPFGYAGSLSPMLAAWLPHGVFLLAALAALRLARK